MEYSGDTIIWCLPEVREKPIVVTNESINIYFFISITSFLREQNYSICNILKEKEITKDFFDKGETL